MEKKKVYLDSCCYNRPYDTSKEPRVQLEVWAIVQIQGMIRRGVLNLVGSSVLDYELSQCPRKKQRIVIESFIKDYIASKVHLSDSEQIEQICQEIQTTGVKTMDAYHLACAIYAKCDYFLSTDKRLLKYQDDRIKIRNPIDFIMERN